MKVKYYPAEQNGKSRSYTILKENDDPVGSVEGYINDDGHLTSVVHVYPDFQQKGLGYAAFKKVFTELNNEIKITRIIGSWMKDEEFGDCEGGMSTNLRLFLQCIENEDSVDCAFKTPTGRWAQKLGFNKCDIKSVSNDSVTVVFYQ